MKNAVKQKWKDAYIRQKLLLRHVLSFSFVILLVMGLVVLTFHTVLLQNIREYNQQQQEYVLKSAADEINKEMEGITQLVRQMTLYSELNPARIQRSVPEKVEAQNELRKLIATEDLTEECVLVSGDYDFAISNSSSYQFDYFIQRFVSPRFSACKNFSDVVSAAIEQPVFPVQVGEKEMVAVAFSYDYGGAFLQTQALVLLPANETLDLFLPPPAANGGVVGIIYQDGQPLLSNWEDPQQLPGWDTLTQQSYWKLDGRKYHVMYEEQSPFFQYAYLVDETIYDEPVTKTTIQVMVLLLGIFVAGNILIALLSYYNYRPIHRLGELLENYLNKKPEEAQSEMHFISSGIGQLIEDNLKLNEHLNVKKQQMKNFCLFKLLHTPVVDPEATLRALNDTGICFDRECFQCISLSLTYTQDMNEFVRRIEEECASQSPYCNLYYLMNGASVVLIFNFDDKDMEMVRFLVDNFSSCYVREIQMTMGVGNVVYGVQDLQKSYTQSQMAMAYAETGAEECLSSFGEMQLNDAIEKMYNNRQVDALLAAIRKDDRQAIAKELTGIKSFIKESRMPRYAIKAMYYRIVNGVLSTSKNAALFEKGNEILMTIGDVLQRTSVDELHQQIEALCYQVVNKTSGVVLLDKILDYIHQNYADVNFSISNMAEHFHMTHQSLGTLFKKEMQITVIDYVTKCKMSKATDLLVHTDLSVAEIVKRVGYIDNSSFSRKFKATIGMTPAEYRRAFQTNDSLQR